MAKYVCSVCGYIYDEETGIPEKGIAAGTKFDDLPEDWVCPLCGAGKNVFFIQKNEEKKDLAVDEEFHELKELSFAQKSALCSNLAKGCEKQYLEEESALFNELAEYYKEKAGVIDNSHFAEISEIIEHDLKDDYVISNAISSKNSDRGAMRSLVWSEKVTRMIESLLKRFETEKEEMLENTNIYVCEICGFIYVGNDLPEICPVCKVTNKKMHVIERG